MVSYYDDNFGDWEITNEEGVRFYNYIQSKSVWKNCIVCGRVVKIMPDYERCFSCALRMRGGEKNKIV